MLHELDEGRAGQVALKYAWGKCEADKINVPK